MRLSLVGGSRASTSASSAPAPRSTRLSLGDFVLSGGEPAALALIDACVRLLPGVIGDEAALDEESFARGLLEYPHYTRPQSWQGFGVPEVLLSGDHAKIRRWREAEAETGDARAPSRSLANGFCARAGGTG